MLDGARVLVRVLVLAVRLVLVQAVVPVLVGFYSDNPVWPVWAWAVQAVVVSIVVAVPGQLVASLVAAQAAQRAVQTEMVAVPA